LPEDQEYVTEAFSEEELTAITDGAEDEEGAADENISDEERLKAASSEEPTKETSAEEETAKVFLDKILRDVCRDVDTRQSQHKEQLGGGQDVKNCTIATEEPPAKKTNSDTVPCDDVDDNVLSDEALDQLDRELEDVIPEEKLVGVTSTDEAVEQLDRDIEEKQLEETSTGTILNGTGEQETLKVVVNGQDSLEECDTSVSDSQDGKLTKASGSSEAAGNDLTIE